MVRLVYQKENFTVVEFIGEKTVIHVPSLRRVMEGLGVQIPYALKEGYGNQSFVKLNDPLFQRAFREIYYPLVLDQNDFVWKA